MSSGPASTHRQQLFAHRTYGWPAMIFFPLVFFLAVPEKSTVWHLWADCALYNVKYWPCTWNHGLCTRGFLSKHKHVQGQQEPGTASRSRISHPTTPIRAVCFCLWPLLLSHRSPKLSNTTRNVICVHRGTVIRNFHTFTYHIYCTVSIYILLRNIVSYCAIQCSDANDITFYTFTGPLLFTAHT